MASFLDSIYQSLAIGFIAKKIGMSESWVKEGLANPKVQLALVQIGKYLRSVNWKQLEVDLQKLIGALPK